MNNQDIFLAIKPSAVGKYFETKCMRNFVLETRAFDVESKDNENKIEIVKDNQEAICGDKGYQKLGLVWENEVVSFLNGNVGRVVCAEGENVSLAQDILEGTKFTEPDTKEKLQALSEGYYDSELEVNHSIYFYQLCIAGRYAYLDKLEKSNELKNRIKWNGFFYPDLVEAKKTENGYKLTVIDIKSSITMKEGYQIQVALYAEMLQKLVDELELSNIEVNQNKAYIYNRGINVTDLCGNIDERNKVKETTIKGNKIGIKKNSFSLEEAKNELEAFFSESKFGFLYNYLLNVNFENTSSELDRLPCIRSNACEFCEYRKACLFSLKQGNSFKLVPGISIAAQQIADKHIASQQVVLKENDNTWKKIYDELIKNPSDMDPDIRYDSFWLDVRGNLDAYNDIMQDEKAKYRHKKASTASFPKTSDFNLILSAQKDPVTSRNFLYSFSFYNTAEKKTKENERVTTYIAEKNSEDAFNKLDEIFVNALYGVLANKRKKDKKGNIICSYDRSGTVQIYVFDAYESVNIKNALYSVLEREKESKGDLYRKAQQLLFWMPDERLLEYSDKLPGETRRNSISVISSAISKLFIIRPESKVSFDLLDVQEFLDSEAEIKIDSTYFGVFNSLNSEKVNDYWGASANDKKQLEINIKEHMKSRMDIASCAIKKMQTDNGIILSPNAQPLKFDIDSEWNKTNKNYEIIISKNCRDNNPVNRMYFALEYESILSRQEIDKKRTQNISTSKESGNIIKLTVLEIEDADSSGIEKDSNKFDLSECADEDVMITDIGNSDNDNNSLNEEGKFKRITFEVDNYEDIRGNMWFAGMLFEDPSNEMEEENEDEYIKELLYGTDTYDTPGSNVFEKRTYNINEIKKIDYYCGQIDSRVDNTVSIYEQDGKSIRVERFVISLLVEENSVEAFRPIDGKPKKYMLTELYMDRNAIKARAGIETCSDIVNDFSKFRNKTYDEIDYDEQLTRIDGKTFSSSQANAFNHLLKNKLTVLLGPPATGKTDFIARTIFTLAAIKKSKGEKLNVLVSAMSHTAINNVLLKMVDKYNEEPFEWEYLDKTDIRISKIGNFDSKQNTSSDKDTENNQDTGEANDLKKKIDVSKQISVVKKNSKTVREELRSEDLPVLNVVGATGWALYNTFYSSDNKKFSPKQFDLIIVDEASQVRVMDAFLHLSCCGPDTRVLFAGDNDQLPPIIKGNYPPIKKDNYDIQEVGSIFNYILSSLGELQAVENQVVSDSKNDLISLGEKHEDVVMLNENFRMNGILCKYSAEEIYDKKGNGKYQSFNNDIASQTLSIKKYDIWKKNQNCKLLGDILDKEYPLVFVMLKGNPNDQADVEIRLVNDIIKQLMIKEGELSVIQNVSVLADNVKQRQTDLDNEFWDKKCGIISPYHRQIKRVRNYLSKSIKDSFAVDKSNIFIGTVDALQGQERDTVIVSYGLYDREKLESQSEFIFSRNRFNVSLTRGKKKTIVILSDVVAKPNITTNVLRTGSDELRKGIDFIHGFARFMSHEEQNNCNNCQNKESCEGSNCDVKDRKCEVLYKIENSTYSFKNMNEEIARNKEIDVFCKKTFDERMIPQKFDEVEADDPRIKSISNISNSYLLEAGAGSGKTTVLVGRMLSMIEKGVPGKKICAITFTNAAADELKERFISLLEIRGKEGKLSEEEEKAILVYEKYLGEGNDRTKLYCRMAISEKDWFIGTLDTFILGIARRYNKNNWDDIKLLIKPEEKDDDEPNEIQDDIRESIRCYLNNLENLNLFNAFNAFNGDTFASYKKWDFTGDIDKYPDKEEYPYKKYKGKNTEKISYSTFNEGLSGMMSSYDVFVELMYYIMTNPEVEFPVPIDLSLNKELVNEIEHLCKYIYKIDYSLYLKNRITSVSEEAVWIELEKFLDFNNYRKDKGNFKENYTYNIRGDFQKIYDLCLDKIRIIRGFLLSRSINYPNEKVEVKVDKNNPFVTLVKDVINIRDDGIWCWLDIYEWFEILRYSFSLKFVQGEYKKFFAARSKNDTTAKMALPEIHKYVRDLMKSNPEIIGEMDYKYFCIDEFQDTSPLQMEIISCLANNAEEGSIFVVGDPKQSIYHFRGADIKCYLSVRDRFERDNLKEILYLPENYRSSECLINFYNNAFGRKDIFRRDENNIQCDYTKMRCASGRKTGTVSHIFIDDLINTFIKYNQNVKDEDVKNKLASLQERIESIINNEEYRSVLFISAEQKNSPFKGFKTFLTGILNEYYNEDGEFDKKGYFRFKNSKEKKNKQFRLLTIHKAKGLEADAVVLFDLYQMFYRFENSSLKYSVDNDKKEGYIFDIISQNGCIYQSSKRNDDDYEDGKTESNNPIYHDFNNHYIVLDKYIKYDNLQGLFEEEFKNEREAMLAENYRKLYVAVTRAKTELLIIARNTENTEDSQDNNITNISFLYNRKFL